LTVTKRSKLQSDMETPQRTRREGEGQVLLERKRREDHFSAEVRGVFLQKWKKREAKGVAKQLGGGKKRKTVRCGSSESGRECPMIAVGFCVCIRVV